MAALFQAATGGRLFTSQLPITNDLGRREAHPPESPMSRIREGPASASHSLLDRRPPGHTFSDLNAGGCS
jgi:hypothetical protein